MQRRFITQCTLILLSGCIFLGYAATVSSLPSSLSLSVDDSSSAVIYHHEKKRSQRGTIIGRLGKRGQGSVTQDQGEEQQHDGNNDNERELTIRRPPKRISPRKRNSSSRQLWPPWPFSMLKQSKLNDDDDVGNDAEDSYEVVLEKHFRSAPTFMWLFARESTRATLNKFRQVASQLWFHLPPGMPPFILVALVPRTVRPTAAASVATTAAAISPEAVRRAIPLVANPFARSVGLSGLGLAIMSWAHSEIHRKRRLTPLSLAPHFRDLSRKNVLPPFLPEDIPSSWMGDESLESEDSIMEDDEEDDLNGSKTTDSTSWSANPSSPSLQKQANSILGRAPTPRSLRSMHKEWQRIRIQQKRERQRAHRLSVLDQLLALQTIKSRAAAARQRRRPAPSKKAKTGVASEADKLGYALVTGASRGIGRAIAVELARYEIPLILVARDVDRLTALAHDLEACYGINCCVIAADLSKPGEAEKIYQTTRAAGLKVDVLVNNAGYSLQGESTEIPVSETNDMIHLNVLALSSLTHLYGKDMKDRKRGRILMVSSICGATAGIASVAVYAATKSFVNTLSLSIGKELEPYGVGLTLVLPGAVKDTEFKARSDTREALCWKIPTYPKTPQRVAETSVRALLRGETECTPGWENRFFLKILKPAVPQRIHNIVAEIFWNPVHLPFSRRVAPTPAHSPSETSTHIQSVAPPQPPHRQHTPRLLKLRGEEVTENEKKAQVLPQKEEERISEKEDSSSTKIEAESELQPASPSESPGQYRSEEPALPSAENEEEKATHLESSLSRTRF